MDLARLKQRAADRIDECAAALDGLALEIHAHPEIAFEERFAARELSAYLEREGAAVIRGAGGLETAFVSETANGRGPTIALLAEYDALPGVGHGCGHNLMGTASVGAYLGALTALGELHGAVRLIGTPAEEGGAGKVKLHAAGVFAGVDAAMMFHASDADIADPLMLASAVIEVECIGRASHAAAAPHAGVNALDALLLGWTAMGALRQLVRSDARIHGIITDGGQAANIIPERAAARIIVRASDPAYLVEVQRRVIACFDGAAQATGCEVRHIVQPGLDLVTTNAPLAAAFVENARALGRTLRPRRAGETSGSTDMGNISSLMPAIHPFLSVTDGPVPWHSHDFAREARTPRALETMRLGAKALAFTAIDLLARPSLLVQAKEAFAARSRAS